MYIWCNIIYVYIYIIIYYIQYGFRLLTTELTYDPTVNPLITRRPSVVCCLHRCAAVSSRRRGPESSPWWSIGQRRRQMSRDVTRLWSKRWAPSSDSWIFIPHSYGQSFLIHAKYGMFGMIITEHWTRIYILVSDFFLSIYFKLGPGTTVPTEGLP